jgi:hypothetical protein
VGDIHARRDAKAMPAPGQAGAQVGPR